MPAVVDAQPALLVATPDGKYFVHRPNGVIEELTPDAYQFANALLNTPPDVVRAILKAIHAAPAFTDSDNLRFAAAFNELEHGRVSVRKDLARRIVPFAKILAIGVVNQQAERRAEGGRN